MIFIKVSFAFLLDNILSIIFASNVLLDIFIDVSPRFSW